MGLGGGPGSDYCVYADPGAQLLLRNPVLAAAATLGRVLHHCGRDLQRLHGVLEAGGHGDSHAHKGVRVPQGRHDGHAAHRHLSHIHGLRHLPVLLLRLLLSRLRCPAGVGCGLSCVGFLILSHYFKRRRGLANACFTAGLGLGHFLGPLFIQLLQDTYGHRGATLVLGAVMLHGFLGTTLYHPVEWHMKLPLRPHPQQVALMTPTSTGQSAHTILVDPQPRHCSRGVNMKVKELSESHQSPASGRRLSANSFDLASMASVTSLDTLGATDLTDHEGLEPPHTDTEPNILSSLRQPLSKLLRGLLRDLAILRRPTALIIAAGTTLVINAQVNFTMMVPFAMQAAGHSLQTAAWCLSLSGVTNLLARMVSSALSDYAWFNMRFFYLLSMFTMAASITVFPFQTQTAGMATVMGMWGAALGTFHGLNNLHTLTVVGLDNFAPMFGARSLTLALGFVTIGPCIGVVRDKSDSYAISMWVVAFLVLLSYLLWLLMPAAVAYDERMEVNQEPSA
ncbi:hypothetical protein O3P69_017517 [Scylla paramamosain]|uniref:Monocarboxylate transporter n=1 Tax=Scylla paramamosain TaxID=85552 RepID=A0AAW0TWV1_SCYPA